MGSEINLLDDPELAEIETIIPSNYKMINLISAKGIQETKYKPINWLIPDLLPEGMAILAGRPKIGKSFLALNLALGIARGGKALSYFDCNRHSILYLPYEDSFIRLQERMNNILSGEDDKKAPDNLFYPSNLDFPKLNDGGKEEIEKIISNNKDIKLVIVDTLDRALKQKKGNSSNSYHEEYDMTSEIQKFAIQHGICILLIHHTRKAEAENVFDEISGTTGLTAAPDTLIMLKKENKSFTLYTTGRDIKGDEFALEFDSCIWNVKGLREEISLGEERREILNLFKGDGNTILKTGDIASATGKTKQNVSKMLGKLEKDGRIISPKFGCYQLKCQKFNQVNQSFI